MTCSAGFCARSATASQLPAATTWPGSVSGAAPRPGVDSAWAFDPAGRPDSLRTSGQMLVFDHDGAGREIRRRIGHAATLTQRWDADHRLTAQSIWNSAGQAQPGGPAQYRAYTLQPGEQPARDRRPSDRRPAVRARPGRTDHHRPRSAWTERYGTTPPATSPAQASRLPGVTLPGRLVYSGTLIRHAGHFSYTHDGQGRITDSPVQEPLRQGQDLGVHTGMPRIASPRS